MAHAPRQEDRGRPPLDWAGPGPRGLFGGQDALSRLVQVLVAWEGQELDELVLGRDTVEELGGGAELVLLPALGADDVVFDLL